MTFSPPQKPWITAQVDQSVVAALAEQLGVAAVTARILVSRGVCDIDNARAFLSPELERDWVDPDLVPGMAQGVERVVRAVESGEHVVVFGDFDLDGVSATAVATRGLTSLGARVTPLVPHRFNEGYGLSERAVERIMGFKPDLVITVDCGISSAEQVALLKAAGIDVVITDHHEPGDLVPQGVPVVNPKMEASCPSRNLAGAGVALKLIHAVGRAMGRGDEWRELTDLAMLGTVADIVPLIGENRALVADGLGVCRRSPRAGIVALCGVSGVVVEEMAGDSVAFSLAPRLNAAGRMADPALALDILLTDDPEEARSLAAQLDELNKTRQSVEADLSAAALALAERVYGGERALVLGGEGWHEGVKGIVASRLASRFGVPVILFSISGGVASGSGRSVGHVDLFRALEACSGLLERFGGHEAAVGAALPESQLEAFRAALVAHLDTLPAAQFVVETRIDADIALDDVGVELGAELATLAPFGHSNPRPMLAVRGAFMNARSRVGRDSSHLRFTAYDGAVSVPAIAFRCADIERLSSHEAPVDIAFELDVDEWRGRRRAQMLVREVRTKPTADPAALNPLIEELFERADEIMARERYSGIGDAPSFNTKLAGVTFEGRQEVLARLEPGAPLRLVRQTDNPYDANACAIFDPHGSQVGFLNRQLAAVLAEAVDRGVDYDVEVTEVTGGEGGQSLGVNVVLSRRDLIEGDFADEQLRASVRADLTAMAPRDRFEALRKAFIGDGSPHAAQTDTLAALAEGQNVLTVMATGRGKSFIFHMYAALIALERQVSSVFVYPLRALVADQAFHLEAALAGVGLTVRVLTGESTPNQRDEVFAALSQGALDIVLTTPEFLHFHARRFVETGRIGFVVVDEAHHVGLSGAGNRPSYGRLGEALEQLGNPTVLAVTATADDAVAQRITETLGITRVITDPTVRSNLAVKDFRGCKDKDAALVALVSRGEKVVIYVNSREGSVRIARMLRKRVGALAAGTAFYNGGLSRAVRQAVEAAFRDGDVKVIVATSAFGEGVNIPDIRAVVLYHLPFNDVEFNQMAGRSGRDGAPADIHLLFSDKDARLNERILSGGAPKRADLATLYRVLRSLSQAEGDDFIITNADIATRCADLDRECGLDEGGVSTGIGIFRELELVSSTGHGPARRLSVVADAPRRELTESIRYQEGLDEVDRFGDFRAWALQSTAEELLSRFNRPILPTRTGNTEG